MQQLHPTRRRRIRIGLMLILLIPFTADLYGQENTKILNILQRFKNWRYGNISLFRLNDESVEQLNLLLSPKEPELSELAKGCRKKEEIEGVIDAGDAFEDENKRLIADAACRAYSQYYASRKEWERGLFRKAYIVTTRLVADQTPTVIALLTSKNDERTATLQDDIDPPTNIYTTNTLQRSGPPPASNAATLYDYLTLSIIQGAAENVTLEAQGIGDPNTQYAPKVFGTAEPINEDSTQMYLRITEGQPQLYTGQNEVIVSLFDLLSYRRYETSTVDESMTSDSGTVAPVYNKSLPKYGIELRYGLDDINYPSIWSNRAALNAIWGSARLGVILPTAGWSSLSDNFGARRKFTSADFGVNGNFDFPIKIIAQSGVFSFGGSYVFGDADSAGMNEIVDEETNLRFRRDYLIRFHTQAHYSFAIAVDQDHFFRFKLGGTVYSVEGWNSVLRETPEDPLATNYEKDMSETIGDISGRIEYMAVNTSTPYGFGLQYFDEAVLGDVWLQVPISQSFAVRFDAKGFAPIFREPYAWENKTVFIPTARFILNF